MSHSLWVEKYRPMDLSTYVGSGENLKEKVKVYLESEDVPHLLFSKFGTGKTTFKIVVNNIDCDYMYINAFLMRTKWMMLEIKSKHIHLLVSNP